MREQLAERDGLRGEFTATFQRFGSKSAYKGPPVVTLLFVDVRDSAGAVVTDHLWFSTCKAWEDAALKPGDRVRFDARVKTYRKGYRGRREDDDLPAPGLDYKLSHPSRIRVLNRAAPLPAAEPEQLELLPS
jgi:hypothetical protein